MTVETRRAANACGAAAATHRNHDLGWNVIDPVSRRRLRRRDGQFALPQLLGLRQPHGDEVSGRGGSSGRGARGECSAVIGLGWWWWWVAWWGERGGEGCVVGTVGAAAAREMMVAGYSKIISDPCHHTTRCRPHKYIPISTQQDKYRYSTTTLCLHEIIKNNNNEISRATKDFLKGNPDTRNYHIFLFEVRETRRHDPRENSGFATMTVVLHKMAHVNVNKVIRQIKHRMTFYASGHIFI